MSRASGAPLSVCAGRSCFSEATNPLLQINVTIPGEPRFSGRCTSTGVVVNSQRTKKAPRKAHVPGGQRTLRLFRERLDPITLSLADMRGVSVSHDGSVSRRWKASVPTSRFGVDLHKRVDPPRGIRCSVTSLLVASAWRRSMKESLKMLASFASYLLLGFLASCVSSSLLFVRCASENKATSKYGQGRFGRS
jgi:hypothetical protein